VHVRQIQTARIYVRIVLGVYSIREFSASLYKLAYWLRTCMLVYTILYNAYTCIRLWIRRTCMYAYGSVRMYVHICLDVRMCMYVWAYACTLTHTPVYGHMYTHRRTHTSVHTRPRTRSRARDPQIPSYTGSCELVE